MSGLNITTYCKNQNDSWNWHLMTHCNKKEKVPLDNGHPRCTSDTLADNTSRSRHNRDLTMLSLRPQTIHNSSHTLIPAFASQPEP